MTDARYHEPNADRPCHQCKHRRYDSFHDEQWCDHKPLPDGLPERLLIDNWGHCEYWELDTVLWGGFND